LNANPKIFRDEWEDDNLVLQACEDFSKYIWKMLLMVASVSERIQISCVISWK
jgi:hypothetical protein